jgi:type IV pilus assembly protein PilC
MTELVHKIGGAFSDFRLDVELFFDKLFHPRKKQEEVATQSSPEAEKKPLATASYQLPWQLKWLRLSKKERLFFFDQLATLIGSNVTLIDSLKIIEAQTKNKNVKKLYADMTHHINSGMSLAQSMTIYPHIFPSIQIALIEAGEKSGNLKTVLIQITGVMESQQDFVRKIKGAMFYPVVLLFLAFLLVTGMMVFVIPKIASMYDQANVQLPKLTQTMIDISGFMSAHWKLLLLGVFGGFAALVLLVMHVRFARRFWESVIWLLPVAGTLSKEKNILIVTGNLAMLLESGVLIPDAMEITERTTSNLHYQMALSKIRHGVVLGQSISDMMGLADLGKKNFKENPLFPLHVSQLVSIGEQTGTISRMLFKIRDNTQKNIDYTLKNISTMIEPIMIFVVAALVGTILLAVMMPFFYIGTTIH